MGINVDYVSIEKQDLHLSLFKWRTWKISKSARDHEVTSFPSMTEY